MGKTPGKLPFVLAALLLAGTVSAQPVDTGFRGEPDRSTISRGPDGQYVRGYRSCTSEWEGKYSLEEEDIVRKSTYASCLVIEGRDSEGVPMLYLLADHHGSVTANFWLAEYLETDGGLSSRGTEKNLDAAIYYYLRTQAIIALIPTFPEPDHFFHEMHNQIHLVAVYRVPSLYLEKYRAGALDTVVTSSGIHDMM